MTPERWEQVKEIFNSAIKYPQKERRVFLDQACSNDAELRTEELGQSGMIRRRFQRFQRWDIERLSNFEVHFGTRLLTACWSCASDEHLRVRKLQKKRVPGDGVPNDTFRHGALVTAEAVVDDLDDCGFPALRASRDDIDSSLVQSELSRLTRAVVENDAIDLHS